jgi:hypothetical protein
MIINSASFKFLLPLVLLPWWHFSLCFLLFAGNQEEYRRKERKKEEL